MVLYIIASCYVQVRHRSCGVTSLSRLASKRVIVPMNHKGTDRINDFPEWQGALTPRRNDCMPTLLTR